MSKLATDWVFNIEETLSIMVEKEKGGLMSQFIEIVMKIGNGVRIDMKPEAFLQLGFLMVNLLFLLLILHKIRKIGKQLNYMADQVSDYMDTVLKSEEESAKESEEMSHRLEKEKQSRLISSVLEEIFP